jgi:hypothetical protein
VFEIVPPLNVTAPSSMRTTPPLPYCAQRAQQRPPQIGRAPRLPTPAPSGIGSGSHRRPAAPCPAAHARVLRCRISPRHRTARCPWPWRARRRLHKSAHERIAPPLGHRTARPSPSRGAHTQHTPHHTAVSLPEGCASPMQRAPMQRAPMQRAPMQSAPMQSAPMQRAPMQRAPMRRALKRRAPCATCHARRCNIQPAQMQHTARSRAKGVSLRAPMQTYIPHETRVPHAPWERRAATWLRRYICLAT